MHPVAAASPVGKRHERLRLSFILQMYHHDDAAVQHSTVRRCINSWAGPGGERIQPADTAAATAAATATGAAPRGAVEEVAIETGQLPRTRRGRTGQGSGGRQALEALRSSSLDCSARRGLYIRRWRLQVRAARGSVQHDAATWTRTRTCRHAAAAAADAPGVQSGRARSLRSLRPRSRALVHVRRTLFCCGRVHTARTRTPSWSSECGYRA